MGLDDSLYDADIENVILSTLARHEVLGYYTNRSGSLTTLDLDAMERELVYTGYSVAYHTIKPIMTAKECGMNPFPLCPEYHGWIKLQVRVAVLEAYLTATDDASARPLLDEARAAIEASRTDVFVAQSKVARAGYKQICEGQ